jgi:hypothetical protein
MQDLHLDHNGTLTLVDKKTWSKISVYLQDRDQNKINVNDITENLIKYLTNETKKDKSIIINQVYPIMTEILLPMLVFLHGNTLTNLLLSGELIKNTLLDSMTIAFLFLKYIQQKELTIVTQTEPLMSQEIEIIKQYSEQMETSQPLTQLLGVNPYDLLQSLIDSGQISKDEIKTILNQDKSKD